MFIFYKLIYRSSDDKHEHTQQYVHVNLTQKSHKHVKWQNNIFHKLSVTRFLYMERVVS